MIRTIGFLASIGLLAACGGDRRDVDRTRTNVTYIAVTPGAAPVDGVDDAVVAAMATAPGGVVAPAPVARFATGPIYSACRAAGRSGASRERCGCVQWVADRHLDASQQRRGAAYFTDQHQLQEVRQSDDRSNAEFWTAWRAFGASAGDLCRET